MPLPKMIAAPELDPEKVTMLADVIRKLKSAVETGADTSSLMDQHNALCGRSDISVDRYSDLSSAMSSAEAAAEALMPRAGRIKLTRSDLESLAEAVVSDDTPAHARTYYLALFEANTPSGTSDLFFWPDPAWLEEIGTEDPSPSQIVDRALRDTAIKL